MIVWLQVSKKYVTMEIAQQMRDFAKPFVEWLEQASEDDGDDEDQTGDGDGDEV